MTPTTIIALVVTLSAAVGYLNHRFFKAPATIAMMMGALLLSIALIFFEHVGLLAIHQQTIAFLEHVDFHHLLMDGLLSFLLFAGTLSLETEQLRKHRWEIGTLAIVGTITSTLLVGTATHALLGAMGIPLSWIYCLLFGALISPTDPIAVLATLKTLKAPKALTAKIAGESLFNDGVGIVIFLTLYQLAFQGHAVTLPNVVTTFTQQTVGGLLYGFGLGAFINSLLKKCQDESIQVLLTLAVVTGGYTLAHSLSLSGPLAMVVCGLMLEHTEHHLRIFWELADEILNVFLFFILGLEILVVPMSMNTLYLALSIIPIVLFARAVAVSIPMSIFKIFKKYNRFVTSILIWGGLRGGLAVALALSLPAGESRSTILVMTYAVVVFSIIIQGSTIQSLIARIR